MASDRTGDEGIPIKVNVVDKRHHASPDESGAERSPYPTFVEELKARAEAAERRAREAVRLADAEIDAVRERLQRDVERRVMQGKAALFSAVLEMVDNIERAAGAAATHSPVLGEGIDLIRQQAHAI
ncbi:MAG: nucleotide exchange factor GrpE, partial [Candidatus Rokuibacteriota bacterium]